MHSASDHRRKIKTQVTILIIQIQSINVRINSILRVQITNIVKKEKDLKFSNSTTKNFFREHGFFFHRENVFLPTFHAIEIDWIMGKKRDAVDYPEIRKIERQLGENPGRDSAVRIHRFSARPAQIRGRAELWRGARAINRRIFNGATRAAYVHPHAKSIFWLSAAIKHFYSRAIARHRDQASFRRFF